MQFTVWRNSPKARVLIEWLITCAFATAVHLMVYQIMQLSPTIVAVMTEYLKMVAKMERYEANTTEYNLLQEASDQYYADNCATDVFWFY